MEKTTTYSPTSKLTLTLALLLTFRMIWLSSFSTPGQPPITAGVLDMRDTPFDPKKTLQLDGEWIFHPNSLISTVDEARRSQSTTIQVPHNCRTDFLTQNHNKQPPILGITAV